MSWLMIVPGALPLSPAIEVICLLASSESFVSARSPVALLPTLANLVRVFRAGSSPSVIIAAASLSMIALISGLLIAFAIVP